MASIATAGGDQQNAEASDPYAGLPKLTDPAKEVVVDGLVVLQIIQNCINGLPALSTGCLLGLGHDDGKLEVTHSFGTPSVSKEQAAQADAEGMLYGEAYQMEMMRLLAKVYVDNNCVEWYWASHLGSFIDDKLVREMVSYQTTLPMSVLFVYDPYKNTAGQLSLKAYRLRDDFIEDYKNRKFRQSTVNEKGESEIFSEIPIVVTNSGMIQSFLLDLQADMPDQIDTDFDRFDLSTNPFLEKNLEFLIESVDKLGNDQLYIADAQKKLQNSKDAYKRMVAKKKLENELREAEGKPLQPEDDPTWTFPKAPNRLKALLIGSQIEEYCDQINNFTGQGFSKLFLAGSLRKGD